MRYGTLVDGQPVPAPNPLRRGLNVIFNPPGEACEEAGYLPIVETPHPSADNLEDTAYYAPSWVERGGKIVRVWTQAAPPEPAPEQPDADAIRDQRIAALESSVDNLIIAALEVSADV